MNTFKNLFYIAGVVSSIIVMCIGAYYSAMHWRLRIYLKEKYYERWRDLTSIGRFGPGGINSFKDLKYIYSDLDNNDENIMRLKDSMKMALRGILSFIIAVVISFIMAENI